MSTAPAVTVQVALAKPTARAVVEHLLYRKRRCRHQPEPSAGMSGGAGSPELRRCRQIHQAGIDVAPKRQRRDRLRQRFERAIAEGDLPPRIRCRRPRGLPLRDPAGHGRAGGRRHDARAIAQDRRDGAAHLAATESGVGLTFTPRSSPPAPAAHSANA